MEVSGIVLTTKDDRKVKLTIEEARELSIQLNKIFNVNVAPTLPMPYPIIIEKQTPPYWGDRIYCTSVEGTLGVNI